MRPIATDGVARSVGRSDCRSVGHNRDPYTIAAELIVMTFGILIRVDSRNPSVRWGCRDTPSIGHCWSVWPIKKHRILELDKRMNCTRTGANLPHMNPIWRMAAILGSLVQWASKPKPDFYILNTYAKFDVPNLSTWVQSAIFGI